jgi:DNA mismatch repair protein MutS2
VRLLSFGSVGIVNHIKDDEAEVRVGSLRMREKLNNLELVFEVSTSGSGASERHDGRDGSRNDVSIPTRRGSGRVKASLEDLRRKAATTELHLRTKSGGHDILTNAELNLIGKTTDEAVDLTDKFLDEAFLNGLSELRIIHGHGTGALRRAITELLKDHPHVARFAAAAQDKGGAGATTVELKS